MAATDLVTEAGLQDALATIAADINGLDGSAGTPWYSLDVFVRANAAKEDGLILFDKSDTTQGPNGSLKIDTIPGLTEVQRRLLTNVSATDQSPFSSETYLAGSNVIMPDTPVVGSAYRCDLRITKTTTGTATPIFNLKIGAAGTIADTTRCTLTFGAGTGVAETVWVTLLFVFTVINSTTGSIEGMGRAVGHLSTTGYANGGSGGGRVPTGTATNFNNTALGGQFIGLSYNGGASAAHTVSLVRSKYMP